MISLYSKKTARLSVKEKLDVFKLKNSHWKFSILSQKKHFIKTIKKNDIHNFLYFEKKLVGYTCLRRSTFRYNDKNKMYLHFDTLIIDKKFRKKNFSNLLMNFNNFIIKSHQLNGILYCRKRMVKFYFKHGWLNLKKNYLIKEFPKKSVNKKTLILT